MQKIVSLANSNPSIKLSFPARKEVAKSRPKQDNVSKASFNKKIYEKMDLDKFEDFCGGEDFLQKPMKFDLRNSGAAAEQGPEPAGMWV